MPLADFIAGCVLSVIGIFAAHHSFLLPRAEGLNSSPYSSAGLVPGLLSLLLLIMALVLLGRALRAGALRKIFAGSAMPPSSGIGDTSSRQHADLTGGIARTLLVVALTLSLPLLLLPRLPFWWATFLFVAPFILIFEWTSDRNRLRTLVYALITAALTSTLTLVIFEEFFLMKLP